MGSAGVFLMLAVIGFAAGMVAGMRIEELCLRDRERKVAEARRSLTQSLAARRAADEVDRALVLARDRLRRAAVNDADLLALARELARDATDRPPEPPPGRTAA